MRITRHAKERMNERAEINKKNQKQFFRGALNHGKSYGEINDIGLRNHLMSLESTGCKAKIYKGYIFIHSKNGKTLYTMYKIPEKFVKEGEKKWKKS